jgi:hypothetical protein
MIIFVLICFCAIAAFAGCTNSSGTQSTGVSGASGSAPPTSGASLTPGSTDVMPANIAVVVDVGEKDYTGMIPVIFQGGLGQVNVKRIDVTLTRTDGTTQTATLDSNKGAEVDLAGTRGTGSLEGQPDRVEVWVTMNNGQTYKTVDVTRVYRSRQ